MVTNFTNVTYLTGFTGDDSYLLVTPDTEILFSDSRYTVQIQEECPGLKSEERRSDSSLLEAVSKAVRTCKLKNLGIEADSVTVSLEAQLRTHLGSTKIQPAEGLLDSLREIKDKDEIEAIRQAVRLAERAFGVVRAAMTRSQREKEIADALDHQIRRFGGRGCSFTPIVGVGDRAALPHYRPGNLRVEESNLLLIDWGAFGPLYLSDLTRVLITGRPTKKLRTVYETVLKAQRAAIASIGPGVLMEDVDATARSIIRDAGYGKRFGHSLGHGIGLEIHEQPRLAARQKRPLKPGMVVTVEPGIYLPGWGGVRLEDDVLVTSKGHEILSSVPIQFDENIVDLS